MVIDHVDDFKMPVDLEFKIFWFKVLVIRLPVGFKGKLLDLVVLS